MPGITGLTNAAANNIANTFAKNSEAASNATTTIASGSRLTKASVDASSLAIAEKLRSNIEVLTQANRNTMQGSAVVQLATDAQRNILGLLTSMKSLTAKANDDTQDSKARALIDAEFQKLLDQVDNIASQVRWNGAALLSGGAGSVTLSAVAAANVVDNVGTIPANTLAAAPISVANSTGYLNGTFTDANVEAKGNGYAVTLTMKNSTPGGEVTQVFKATVAAPVAGGALKVQSTSGEENILELTYAADVSGITNAATFEAALKGALNIGVNKIGANITSESAALNGGVAANPSVASNTPAGTYALSYNNVNNVMTLSTGAESLQVLMTAAGAQTVQFANGVSVSLDGTFALGTAINQIVFNVDASTSAVAMNLQVAELSSDVIVVNVAGCSVASLGLSGLDVTDRTNAVAAGNAIDLAMQAVNSSIASLGAQQKQLEYASNNLKTTIENNVSARGVYNDADIAAAMTDLTKSTVFTQLSQAMLSQSLSMQRELVRLAQG